MTQEEAAIILIVVLSAILMGQIFGKVKTLRNAVVHLREHYEYNYPE